MSMNIFYLYGLGVYVLNVNLNHHIRGLDDNALSYINAFLSEYEYFKNQFKVGYKN